MRPSETAAVLSPQGDIANQYNLRQEAVRAKQCSIPYQCSTAAKPLVCMKKGMKMPARFFGQEPISEALGFPEFAWNLEGDVIVRDGVELRPAENYIDEQTVSVSLLMVFFVPAVQVIALPSPLCPGRCSHDGKG